MEKCPYHVDIITERVTRQFLITVSISCGLWTQQIVVQDTPFTRTVTKLNTLVYCIVLQSSVLCTHIQFLHMVRSAKLHLLRQITRSAQQLISILISYCTFDNCIVV